MADFHYCNCFTQFVKLCSYDLVSRMIQENPNCVYQLSDFNMTALHHAVTDVIDIEIVELLVSNGAIVNAKNDFGETPLHLLMKQKHVPVNVLKYLLFKEASLYEETNLGKTPVHYYLQNGILTKAVLKILIMHSVRFDQSFDMYGRKPIHYYLIRETIDCNMLPLLLKNCDMQHEDVLSNNMLHYYLSYNANPKLKIFRILHESGVHFKPVNVFNETLAYLAIMCNNEKIIYYLLGKDSFFVDEITTNGNTCLAIAISSLNYNLVSLIINLQPKVSNVIYSIKKTIPLFENENVYKEGFKCFKKCIKYVASVSTVNIASAFENQTNTLALPCKICAYAAMDEIYNMKHFVLSKNLSVYDLVFKKNSDSLLYRFYKHPSLISFSKKEIYGLKICRMISRASFINDAVNKIIQFLNSTESGWNALPYDIKEKIILNLSFVNIIKLDDSLNNYEL
ncbi:ankyrin repeat protein [Pteropox virus]|uniref:Ankyrin repeat protein n=1 Tax=Pteropox virus TaxID=1873698 RepID=A0A1B1MRA3_9POXV|nr:ankyrin repeat protein [Pteropox virus]ANS71092.1 ankyrin repeat protein [Pteropox virus]